MYSNDVVTLTGTAAAIAVVALFSFLFGLNWYALGAGAIAFVAVCAAIALVLRTLDRRDSLRNTSHGSYRRN